ncbi:hypothetical protein VcTj87_13390 [Vibrio comitans]
MEVGFSAISYQLSAISYQLSAISYQLSAISYQLEDSATAHNVRNRLLTEKCSPLVTGGKLECKVDNDTCDNV